MSRGSFQEVGLGCKVSKTLWGCFPHLHVPPQTDGIRLATRCSLHHLPRGYKIGSYPGVRYCALCPLAIALDVHNKPRSIESTNRIKLHKKRGTPVKREHQTSEKAKKPQTHKLDGIPSVWVFFAQQATLGSVTSMRMSQGDRVGECMKTVDSQPSRPTRQNRILHLPRFTVF